MCIVSQEPDQQQASKNSNKRKRGRPKKLMIVPITAEGILLLPVIVEFYYLLTLYYK